ncbi:MAG: DUF4836 family protein, partial [Bacteroidota bacterium]
MKFARLSRVGILCFLGLSLVFTSCKEKKGSGVSSYIPEEGTFMVFSIDFQNIMEKADYENVKTLDFFKDAIEEVKEESELLVEIMNDPRKSGIDLAQDAYIFVEFEEITEEDPKGAMGFVAALADKNQFEKVLKESPEPIPFVKGNGYTRLADDENEEFGMAWNDEVLFIGARFSDDMDRPAGPLLDEFFAKKQSSIAKNSAWKALSAEDHDIAQFVNFDPIFEAMEDELSTQLALFGIEEKDLKDNYITAFTDFKNGEVYSETGYFLQPALTKDINMFFKDEVKTDFAKYVPNNGQMAYMTFGLDIRGVEQVLKEKGMLGLANMQMAQLGLTSEDLSKGFGGDIMLSVHLEGEDSGFGLFGMDIKDREIFNKFLELGEQFGALSKESDDQYIINNTSNALGELIRFDPTAEGDARLVIKDNILFVTDRKDVYTTILEGGFDGDAAMDKSIHNEISDNLWGLKMVFEPIEAMIKEELPGFNLESVKATTTKKKSETALYMKNKEENILKSLVKLINDAYLQEKEREKDYQWDE